MFQMLSGLALLMLMVFPVLVLFIAFYQNLCDCIRVKPRARIKAHSPRAKDYNKGSEDLGRVKLRVVK